jgi:hypothetical protein
MAAAACATDAGGTAHDTHPLFSLTVAPPGATPLVAAANRVVEVMRSPESISKPSVQ